MPCDTISRIRTEVEKRTRDAQFKALVERIKNGTAQFKLAGNVLSIEGWTWRGGWCDECAIRALRQSENFVIRQKLATAVPVGKALTFGHSHSH